MNSNSVIMKTVNINIVIIHEVNKFIHLHLSKILIALSSLNQNLKFNKGTLY